MERITITGMASTPVHKQPLEIVERKGLGHPDTICDSVAEILSSRLCQEYQRQFGKVLHYNLDKSLLVAGNSEPAFGGGRVTKPMKLVLGDRATVRFGDRSIDLDPLIQESVDGWFSNHLVHVDPARHLVLQNEIQPGSAELTGIFQREQVVANDTSAAVGYAPLSETEQVVLKTENWLNSVETRQRLPVIGEDVKIMAVRNGPHLRLTVAIAFVDRFVSSVEDYFEQKLAVSTEIAGFVGKQIQSISEVDVELNTLDDPERGMGGIYLTVTGTSAECGDSGEVGRGNNVKGLISLNRPVSNEAAAGKNPVSHVGKIYNLLSYQVAERICESVDGVDEVYVWLVSQIGRPIAEPWVAAARINPKPGFAINELEPAVRSVIEQELHSISNFCDQLMSGAKRVC